MQFTTTVTDKEIEGESLIYRNKKAVNSLVTSPDASITTTWDIIEQAASKYAKKDCLGTREIVDTIEEVKKITKKVDGKDVTTDKKWSYFKLGPFKYITFQEFYDRCVLIGSGLVKLGITSDNKFQVYAATSANWLNVAHGCNSQSIPIVTAYDTLGESGLTHSLVETEAKGIFTDPGLLKTLTKPLQSAKKVSVIITNGPASAADKEAFSAVHKNVKIITLDELLALGKENKIEPKKPSVDSLACIMYTSGSTGPPKGVVLLHKNVVAALGGIITQLEGFISSKDTLILYLPLAHILEFAFETMGLFLGCTMGYGTVRTLTDANVRQCKGDIAELRPTIMVGVPAVWEQVRKGIINKVEAGPALVKSLFWGAFNLRSALFNYGLPGKSVIDHTIMKRVKAATGGRLRMTLAGGAPIAKETQHFLSMTLCPMITGYGMTETAAMSSLMSPYAHRIGPVGAPMACLELKLVDVPDAGYSHKNNPPQGEIWLRGPCVTSGYYNRPDETKEAFMADGWFATGDIGQFSKEGQLEIIDRKKNLVKTLNGEYIALEKLESLYRICSLITNVCVYADVTQTKPIAIVVAAEPTLRAALKTKVPDAADDELEQLMHNKAVLKILHEDLISTGKRGGLAGIELIQGVVLSPEEFTPQNGLVTSAQKLNRKAILQKFKSEIDAAYKS